MTNRAIFDPNRGWRQWYEDEIYIGDEGKGIYVPNVNDAVFSWREGLRRVVAVDTVTGLSELGPAHETPVGGVTAEDVFIGRGGGHISESFRLHVDKTSVPHMVNFDAFLEVSGANNSYIKIFKGIDTTKDGDVISAYYDSSGNYVSDNIPLELVSTIGIENKTMKRPVPGHVVRDLGNGELCTVVVYNDVGGPVAEARLLARDGTLVRRGVAVRRLVSEVSLVSDHISPIDSNVILFPVNMPVHDVEMQAIVKYTDGTEELLDVDGKKVSLHGLNDFMASSPGRRYPLVLSYQLGNNEEAVNGGSGDGTILSRNYTALAIEASGSYSVKLFVCPVWLNHEQGYQLRYYLHNLNGDINLDVTDRVQFAPDTGTFLPKAYGQEQRLTVAIELNDVLPALPSYRYVQNFAVTLLAAADEETTPWLIHYVVGGRDTYGDGIIAKYSGNENSEDVLDLSNAAGSQNEWLGKLYRASKPMFGGNVGLPRTPSHFEIIIDNVTMRHDIGQWDQSIKLIEGQTPDDGKTMLIKWVLETETSDVYLATTCLVMRPVTGLYQN